VPKSLGNWWLKHPEIGASMTALRLSPVVVTRSSMPVEFVEGLHESRCAVFDVSECHIQDEKYFQALYAQLDDGGYAACCTISYGAR
jgi:hypothetical protein